MLRSRNSCSDSLYTYYDSELSIRRERRVRRHLGRCGICGVEYARIVETQALLRGALRPDAASVPAGWDPWGAIKSEVRAEALKWEREPVWRRAWAVCAGTLGTICGGRRPAPLTAWEVALLGSGAALALVLAGIMLVRPSGEAPQHGIEGIARMPGAGMESVAHDPVVALALELHGEFLDAERDEVPVPFEITLRSISEKEQREISFNAFFTPAGAMPRRGISREEAEAKAGRRVPRPAYMPMGFAFRDACVREGGKLVQLRYTDGVRSYSLFESGRFPWAGMGSEKRMVRTGPDAGERCLVWGAGARGLAVVGNIREEEMVRVADSVADEGGGSFTSRLMGRLGCTAYAADAEAGGGDRFQAAYELFLEGEYGRAAEAYRQALRTGEPVGAGPHYNLGRCCLLLGEGEGALASLKRADEIEPGNAGILLYLGIAHIRNGRYERGYDCISRADALESGSARTRAALALYHSTVGRPDRAAEIVRAVAEKGARIPAIHFTLGWLEFEMGNNDAAISAWRDGLAMPARSGEEEGVIRALARMRSEQQTAPASMEESGEWEMDDLALWARYGIAWALSNRGEYERAAGEYREVIAQSPGSRAAIQARYYLARILDHKLGMKREAASAYEELLEWCPPGWRAASALGDLAELYLELEGGGRGWEKVQVLYRNCPLAEGRMHILLSMADFYRESDPETSAAIDAVTEKEFPCAGPGSTKRARERYSPAGAYAPIEWDSAFVTDREGADPLSGKRPSSAAEYLGAAREYYRAWRFGQAKGILEEAVKRYGLTADMGNCLAFVYSSLGDHEEAARVYRSVLDSSPNPGTLYACAELYYWKMRDGERAREAARELIRAYPDSPHYVRALELLLYAGSGEENLAAGEEFLRRAPYRRNADAVCCRLAERYEGNGRREKAAECYARLIARYPYSTWRAAAEDALARLGE